MGDRGNIFFVDQAIDRDTWGGVYLYSHWAGSDLPFLLQRALDRGRDRWGDSQYFARILFCEMIRDDVEGLTGFGISSKMWDNEHLVIRVNDLDQIVSFHEAGREAQRDDEAIKSWSYEEYCDGSPTIDEHWDSHY